MGDAKAVHPSQDELRAFVGGKLSVANQAKIESHVADCDTCCETLRTLPHETLVERMRPSDTSAWPEETNSGIASDTNNELPSSSASTTSPILPAELVDHPRYRIVRQLGAGGMGVVYEAEHRLMQRPVALKVINRRLVNNRVAVERFHLEVRAAAKLAHRNIVTAYDAEQAGDLHFLVMEFVEGISLADLVRQRGPLSVLHACNFALQAAQGLQHAAQHNMVHRDIKPQNLMRTPKGTIKILDFGLARLANEIEVARLTRAGVALGTADYIAPEQVEDSRHVDIRADLYSLGCTLYFLLAGRVPYPNGTLVDKVLAHMNEPPPPLLESRPDLPAEVIHIVDRMMAKDRTNRYQTPAEVIDALRPFGKANLASDDKGPGAGKVGGVGQGRNANLVVEPANANMAAPGPPGQTGDGPPADPGRPPLVDRAASPPPPPLPLPDLFDLPLETGPARPAARLASPRPRRRAKPALLRWLRSPRSLPVALAIGVLLVAIGVLLLPAVRDALSRFGPDMENETIEHDGSPRPLASGLPPGPAATPRDSQSPANANTRSGQWIDLLARIDAENHPVSGRWIVNGEDLSVDANANARLALPYEAPDEYDLEVCFTRETGEHSIAVFFVAGNGQATFEIDAWGQHLAGIQNIDGQTIEQRAAGQTGPAIRNGESYTALIQVRRGHVSAYLNGQQLATYDGDGSNLSVLDMWRLPSGESLGVGAYDSATTFHRIRVRPVGADVDR